MLLDLPDEVLLLIADELESEADLSALSRTNPLLYCLLSDILHRNNVRYYKSSALFWAVRHNRLDTIERLLYFGADVNLVGRDNLSVLEIAACDGKATTAEFLLKNGAFFRGPGGQPSPPVCAAASMGNTDVLKVLLNWDEFQEHDITPAKVLHSRHSSYLMKQLFVSDDFGSYPSSTRYTVPLFLAIAGAHDSTAEWLIQHPKVDLNYPDLNHRVPLHWAISHNRNRIITALITQGADPNIPYANGQTPLQAVLAKRQGQIARLLLGFDSVDPNYRPHNQHPAPLCLALCAGWRDPPTVAALVKRPDIDLDCELPYDGTVEKHVLQMKNPEVLRAFLARRYKGLVGSKNEKINDAFFDAAKAGNVELVDAFLANGADPTIQDRMGRMPHFYAAHSGKMGAFDRFLQTGKVHIEAIDAMGRTPLFWACFKYQPEMVKHLLELEANPNRRDIEGATPLLYIVKAFNYQPIPRPMDVAEEWVTVFPSRETIRALLEYGADPFFTDSVGRTILSYAFSIQGKGVAEDLMRHAQKAGQWDKVHECAAQNLQEWDDLIALCRQSKISS
ncbi:ankyrin repeat-containing domain protein [Aspergillus venezuelensis]